MLLHRVMPFDPEAQAVLLAEFGLRHGSVVAADPQGGASRERAG